MHGNWYGLDKEGGDQLLKQRLRLGITKQEMARRMFDWMATQGVQHADGKLVSFFDDHFGFGAWATASACRRAIDELEGNQRWVKERCYVDAMHAVLGMRVLCLDDEKSAVR